MSKTCTVATLLVQDQNLGIKKWKVISLLLLKMNLSIFLLFRTKMKDRRCLVLTAPIKFPICKLHQLAIFISFLV